MPPALAVAAAVVLAAAPAPPPAVAARDAAPPRSVRIAGDAQIHRIAVEIMQPRWTCFEGLLARRGPWGALRAAGYGGCPELPWAIVVREDRDDGWQEVRRFTTRRAACGWRGARGLPAATRAALLGCAR